MEHLFLYNKVLGFFCLENIQQGVWGKIKAGRDTTYYSVALAVHACCTAGTHFIALDYVAVNF